MEKLEQFFDLMRTEMTVTLATAAEGSVTMRVVSPVVYEGRILLFTEPDSVKFGQLKKNPRCCVGAGLFFAECGAEFMGPTLAPENAALRDAYCAKFPGAFDVGMEFGGRTSEFLLLTPKKLTGWAFPGGVPTPDGVPTEPFSLELG